MKRDEVCAPSMLQYIDWHKVSATSAREQSNRERHAPVVSVFRWWARRPHSAMGAILDAAKQFYGDHFLVADPFSGGGTVTFEAARRNLKAYAQDLYPWPAGGLATALSYAQPDELQRASSELMSLLGHHKTMYTSEGGGELAYILRVRRATCPCCKENFFFFPEPLVSLASRAQTEKNAYFGCALCGSVTLAEKSATRFKCCGCGIWHVTKSSLSGTCPHCKKQVDRKEILRQNFEWESILVGELYTNRGRTQARLRPVLPGDCIAQAPATPALPQLKVAIPTGIETKRLLDAGVKYWGDLYTERQAKILTDALTIIPGLNCTDAIKERLAYAVIGAAEMPAYLSRWDRFHLKAFEGLANHRYASTTIAVEMNPLSPVGRGTLPRRFLAAHKALLWLTETCGSIPSVRHVSNQGRRCKPTQIVVATGSSERQALPNRVARLVLTDPPYFDDVQYGELARLFHVWLSLYKPIPHFDEMNEAVPNRKRGKDALSYESAITACLKESRRTLAQDGRLVLTFHNKKLVAWESLAGAIAGAGFTVIALAVVLAENAADHCKRNVESTLHDLVIECVPSKRCKGQVRVATQPQSIAEKNLVAAGLALAQAVSHNDGASFSGYYRAALAKFKDSCALIR